MNYHRLGVRDMEALLNNPTVQNIGLFLLGIVVSTVFYLLGRSKPKLVWGVSSHSPVLMDNLGTQKLFKITYQDRILERLSVTSVYIINRGRQSIRKTDVAEPIKFHFNKGIEIIDFINLQSNNKTILLKHGSICTTDEDKGVLQVDFDYLNPREGASFTILHTGTTQYCFKVNATLIDTKLKEALI